MLGDNETPELEGAIFPPPWKWTSFSSNAPWGGAHGGVQGGKIRVGDWGAGAGVVGASLTAKKRIIKKWGKLDGRGF